MNYRRAFEIAFVGLKPGIHNYEYHIDDKFFADYGKQDFTNCNATVKLQLDKKNSFMLLKFDVSGTADVLCDRCGNTITIDLWEEFKTVVKMVDDPEQMNEQEEDPDIYYISRNESHLHLEDWIHEFINLSIPLQKTCGNDDKGHSLCNPEVLAKLKQMEEDNNNTTSPVWKGLDQFKNLE